MGSDALELSGDQRFINPDVSASYLGVVLNDEYGIGWLDWEPETKWQMFRKDFRTDIHPVNKEKINAVATLLLIDDYWMEWNTFEAVTKALNNEIASFHMMSGCTPGEMAWSIEQASRIRSEKFSDEVAAYVRANCLNAGYVIFPAQLSFAQDDIATDLEKAVHEAWVRLSPNKDFDIAEDPVGVQVARLNSVRHYVDDMDRTSEAISNKKGA